MPCKLQIVGMKRNKGVSTRTNKPYDMCDVYFLYEDRYVDGMACCKWTFPGARVEGLSVGDFVEALLFFKNFEVERVYIL